jgi:hypothetical protein
MYHRLRRTSLKMRSCITDFRKRLSRLSCDSPSRNVTVANTLTSFPLLTGTCTGHGKPGSSTHAPDGSRVCTTLAFELSPYAWTQDLDSQHLNCEQNSVQALAQSTWLDLSLAAVLSHLCCLPAFSTVYLTWVAHTL